MLYEICHADPSPLTTQRKIEDLARSRSLLPSDAVEDDELEDEESESAGVVAL